MALYYPNITPGSGVFWKDNLLPMAYDSRVPCSWLHLVDCHIMAILRAIGGFPKLEVPYLGIPIMRIIIFWGLYWGPPI